MPFSADIEVADLPAADIASRAARDAAVNAAVGEFIARHREIVNAAVTDMLFVADQKSRFDDVFKKMRQSNATWAFAVLKIGDADAYESAMARLRAAGALFEKFKSAFQTRIDGAVESITSIEDEVERDAELQKARAETDARRRRVRDMRVRAHGRVGLDFYYSSSEVQELIVLSAREHVKNSFLAIAPLEYWLARYQTTDRDGNFVPDWEQATSALMESCRKQEHFDPSALRGRGARLETLRDGSTRFVFNTGRFLIIDGARVEYENYKGDYFYTASSRAIEIADEQLDAEARMKFSAFIARFRWEKPHYADFVIGWLLMAAVAGALEWRCMLWITGAAGSGKSFLLDRVIALLFGRALVAVNSSTTDKGLASLLGNDSVPFTFDEAESSDEASNARNRATLRALRAAAAGSQAVRAVGSSSGKARTTQINGAGAFASIADAVTDQADEQRFLTPKLLPPNLDMEAAAEIARQQEENRAYVDETLTPEFAARFLSFAVRNFSGIRQSIDVFAEALTEDLGNRRFGLHFGTAFGCRYFFEYGEAPFDVAQARDWFVRRGIAMSDLVDLSATRSPAEIAASDLLSARVEVTDAGRYSIADLIRAVVIAGSAGDRLSQKLADRTLRYHGIIVDFDGKRIRLAGKHMQLNKIFERSSSGKNAFDALKTLTEPDDRIFQKTVHFAPSGSHHCIAFKLVKILDTQRDLAAPEAGAAAAGHPEAIGMSGRIMSLDVWVTNLDDRNVRETIDSLRRIARDLNLATVRGISQIEARLVLARYGIVPHMDDRVLIARRHPKLMEMLGRGGNAVGRDYAQVLQPLIRGEYGTQELGGVHCEMIELDLAANRDAPF